MGKKSLDKLSIREMYQLRWYLGQILFLVAIPGIFSIETGSGLFAAASLLLVALTCLFPKLPEQFAFLHNRFVPWLIILFVIGDFIASGGDILPPLVRLILLLALYRSLHYRKRREDLQILLLTLFILVATGVLSQELSFGFQILVYSPIAVGQLLAVTLSEQTGNLNDPVKHPFKQFRISHFFNRLFRRMDGKLLLLSGCVYIMGASLSALLFILLPRFELGQALPFLRLQTTQSLTGFTDHIQYGDVVGIQQDDQIAMRVDLEDEEPPSRPYWRMVVLDNYKSGGFSVSDNVLSERRTLSNYIFENASPAFDTQRLSNSWTVYLEGGVSAYLPVPGNFRQLRFNNRHELQVFDATNVFRSKEINSNTLFFRYRGLTFSEYQEAGPLDGSLSDIQPQALDTTDEKIVEKVEYPVTLLVYPKGQANRKVLQTALDSIGFEPEMPAQVFSDRLVQYLQQKRGYSVNTSIPEGKGDLVLRWMDSGNPGHCELFAGAFTLISRYAGYPTRLVTGFLGGDYNGFEGYFMVRNRHAHAWCEIYTGHSGWYRVDPTPGNSFVEADINKAVASGILTPDRTFKAYLDSLKVLWYRRVIQFDSEDQAEMAREIGADGLNFIEDFKKMLADFKRWLANLWNSDLPEKNGKNRFYVVAGILSFIMGIICVFKFFKMLKKRISFEAYFRKKAGDLLKNPGISNQRAAASPEWDDVQRIRYGECQTWPSDPEETLKQTRKSWRKLRKADG